MARRKKTKKVYRKKKIPKAVREQVWIKYCGRKFNHRCYTRWCKNKITVFNFHVGHDIPESKGGTLDLCNLYSICGKCNRSMSNRYTIVSPIDGLPDMVGIWNDYNISEEVEMDIVG